MSASNFCRDLLALLIEFALVMGLVLVEATLLVFLDEFEVLPLKGLFFWRCALLVLGIVDLLYYKIISSNIYSHIILL